MVPFLISHIPDQIFLRRWRISKCAVPYLPVVKQRKKSRLFYKCRTGQLHILDKVRQRHRRMKMCNQMDMIFDSVDDIRMTPLIPEYARHILKQFQTPVTGKRLMPVLRRKNNLIQNLRVSSHNL